MPRGTTELLRSAASSCISTLHSTVNPCDRSNENKLRHRATARRCQQYQRHAAALLLTITMCPVLRASHCRPRESDASAASWRGHYATKRRLAPPRRLPIPCARSSRRPCRCHRRRRCRDNTDLGGLQLSLPLSRTIGRCHCDEQGCGPRCPQLRAQVLLAHHRARPRRCAVVPLPHRDLRLRRTAPGPHHRLIDLVPHAAILPPALAKREQAAAGEHDPHDADHNHRPYGQNRGGGGRGVVLRKFLPQRASTSSGRDEGLQNNARTL